MHRTALHTGRVVERAAWAAALAFLLLAILASMLGSRVLAGLAGLFLGAASGLFAAAGLVSGEHVTRQGTIRRATEPVHYWAMTLVMGVLALAFAAAGGMILTGMIEAGFGGR